MKQKNYLLDEASSTNSLRATKNYIAQRVISNGKMSLNSSLQSQKNTKAISKTYELSVYGDTHYFTKLFCINMLKIVTT